MVLFFQQVVNGVMAGSTYALVALGFGLVFSVMRVLNMAHPDLAMVGAFMAYVVSAKLLPAGITQTTSMALGVGAFLVVLLGGMLAASAGGVLVERLVIRPTRGTYVLIPFIATAGVGIFLENGVNAIFGSNPVSLPSVVPYDVIDIGGVTFTIMQLITLLVALVMAAALRFYVKRSRWGLATRAVAEFPDVASACGINVSMVSVLTIGIASGMAGAAGVTIALLQTSAQPFMGLLLGLKSFVCMLVAGNRHIEAILVVALALGILESLVSGYVSSQFRDAVAFGLLLTILLFRPSGLFGSYAS